MIFQCYVYFWAQWRERVICFLFLDRMYQELSNGMLGFYNCLKIADVPFPLPYAQLLGLLLIAFSCLIPFYDAWLHPSCEFVNRCHEAREFVSLTLDPSEVIVFTSSAVIGPILCFFLFESLWCLNEVPRIERKLNGLKMGYENRLKNIEDMTTVADWRVLCQDMPSA